jgi:DNA polymerase III sliding clamp (beta) subunit (PCNA family)
LWDDKKCEGDDAKMKLEINRKIMLEAAKSAAKVAPTNSPLEVLNSILIEANEDTGEVFLTATNFEVSIQLKIRASVWEGGETLIYPRMLVDMMSKLDGEFVVLAAESPNLLKIIGGRCTYNIKCLPTKSYPKPTMPFPEECVILTGVCSLVKRTTFAVSEDGHRPALQCVSVKFKDNAVHAVACDSSRIMMIKDTADPTEEREFLIPGRALQLLALVSSDTDVFEVGDIGNEIVFMRGDMIFTIRKLATDGFVDIDAMVQKLKPAYTAVAESGELREALKFASIGAKAGTHPRPVNLVLADGEIILRRDSEFSESTTAISANVSAATPDAGFHYNVFNLLKLFQVIHGRVKLMIDEKGFLMIKTRNEVYCQVAVRAPSKTAEKSKSSKKAKAAKVTESAKVAIDVKTTEDSKSTKKPKRAKGAEEVKEVA